MEEFAHECLRNIGGVIEGSIKPYSMELLHQVRIFKGISTTKKEIDGLDLGNVIDELIKFSSSLVLFSIEDVRLNQWRNISQHFSISFLDEQIICSYGRPKNRRKITINKNMLFQITQKVFMVHRCLKLASTLFGIDNLEEMIDNGIIPIDNLNIRSEARILNMVSAIASQGFEVVDFQTDEKNAKLIIQDVSKLDPELRKFHASQFIEELWLNTNSSSVTVDYLEHDGTPNLRTQASTDLFERALKSDEPMKTIAAEVEMFDLKTKKIIPKLVDKTVKNNS